MGGRGWKEEDAEARVTLTAGLRLGLCGQRLGGGTPKVIPGSLLFLSQLCPPATARGVACLCKVQFRPLCRRLGSPCSPFPPGLGCGRGGGGVIGLEVAACGSGPRKPGFPAGGVALRACCLPEAPGRADTRLGLWAGRQAAGQVWRALPQGHWHGSAQQLSQAV